MADVNVTVMVDGKAVFAAGAAGAPDGCAVAVAALQLGVAHFQSIKTTPPPAPTPAAAKPQDTSL